MADWPFITFDLDQNADYVVKCINEFSTILISQLKQTLAIIMPRASALHSMQIQR